MRIVIVGAGVIGSIYGDRLARSGHDVTLLARGRRLADLRAHGLVVEDARSGQRTQISLPVLDELSGGDRYDLALGSRPCRAAGEHTPVLLAMADRSDVLFFGNTTGRQTELAAAIGERALFGFPAAGGVRDGVIVRYVIIQQQKTMLGESVGSPRLGLADCRRCLPMRTSRPTSAPTSAAGCSDIVPSSSRSASRSIDSMAIQQRSPPTRAPCG